MLLALLFSASCHVIQVHVDYLVGLFLFLHESLVLVRGRPTMQVRQLFAQAHAVAQIVGDSRVA